jgi:RNA polymerase sigma-70 factor (ECF subfamily)
VTSVRGIQATDADLVVRDFAALFDRHATAVHRYLARRIGRTIADDLLAQTFLVAFERRTRYDRSRPDARPWLYGIATNLLRRHHRDEVRQYQAFARTGVDPVLVECPDDRIVERVDADAWSLPLAAALAELRTGDREVLLLFAWGELSYAEIADALGIPIGTVRSRLNRARSIVRRAVPQL